MGTLGDTHGIRTQRAQPGTGHTGMCRDTPGVVPHVSPSCPRAGVGAHRVSSGSDSGSRVLGFCSIHRNSIKERSAPTEGAPAPRGGHGGGATAGGPRRGATPRTPWCPSVLSTAQHPGPDPAGQGRQPRPAVGDTERTPREGCEATGDPQELWPPGSAGCERARAPRAGQGHEGRARTRGGSDVQGVCNSTGAGPEGTAR